MDRAELLMPFGLYVVEGRQQSEPLGLDFLFLLQDCLLVHRVDCYLLSPDCCPLLVGFCFHCGAFVPVRRPGPLRFCSAQAAFSPLVRLDFLLVLRLHSLLCSREKLELLRRLWVDLPFVRTECSQFHLPV